MMSNDKNYGKKLDEVHSFQSKWWHWNVRLYSLVAIIVGVLGFKNRGQPFPLIGAIILSSIFLWIGGKKSQWEGLKYIVYEKGILFPIVSKWSHTNKPLFESLGGYLKFRNEKEFVPYSDMMVIENKKPCMDRGKLILVKSGYKYFVQKYSEKKLLPYIKEKMGTGTDGESKKETKS